MAISHCYWYPLVQNGNFTLLLTASGQEWQFHTTTYILWSRLANSHCYLNLVVKFGRWTLCTWWTPQYQWRDTLNTSTKKLTRWTYFGWWTPHMLNGNFTLLLNSSGQEWQFDIATYIKQSRMVISHCYWHLMVKLVISCCYLHLVVDDDNFTLLLISSFQEW